MKANSNEKKRIYLLELESCSEFRHDFWWKQERDKDFLQLTQKASSITNFQINTKELWLNDLSVKSLLLLLLLSLLLLNSPVVWKAVVFLKAGNQS